MEEKPQEKPRFTIAVCVCDGKLHLQSVVVTSEPYPLDARGVILDNNREVSKESVLQLSVDLSAPNNVWLYEAMQAEYKKPTCDPDGTLNNIVNAAILLGIKIARTGFLPPTVFHTEFMEEI